MEQIISTINSIIEQGDCTSEVNQTLELLIKARSIEILKAQVLDGNGFAIEAISRIAASNKIPSYLAGTATRESNG